MECIKNYKFVSNNSVVQEAYKFLNVCGNKKVVMKRNNKKSIEYLFEDDDTIYYNIEWSDSVKKSIF